MKTFSEISAERLASVFAEVTAEMIAASGYVEERVLCARASDRLQRLDDDLIVVTEHPAFDGSASDAIADIVVRSRPRGRELWAEVKPILIGSNYWGPSKFFRGTIPSTQPHLATSIILDDIDKLRVHLELGRSVAFVLILAATNLPVEPDSKPPVPGEGLAPGQILDLSIKRFTAALGVEPRLKRSPFPEAGLSSIALFAVGPR